MMKSKFRSKIISVGVVISLLLTCFAMPATAVNSQNASGTYDSVTTPSIDASADNNLIIDAQPIVQNPVLKSAIPLIADDCKILQYIDEDYFQSDKHMLRLTTLEELNTYVFQNHDGTRTVYIMDENVKYVDASGSVKEKDLTLVNKTHGFSITQSDIDLMLPSSLSAGVDMTYSGYSIKLTPQGTVNAIATKQGDNSVLYTGAFSSNASLKYTPTLSGIKEDIILSEYTESTSYAFELETSGLRIFNNGAKYYLATSQSSDPIFYLGDIIVYDAIGKPDMGTIMVTPIAEGQKYLLTITANDEFLSDPSTVYPVTIDPTIEVSDNSVGGSIEDAPIYENYPDRNFGAYVYNRVGTPSEAYGVGRTVVRLTGLIESDVFYSLNAEQIESVYFYATEASGGAAHTINIHPLYEPGWTESGVTWNNYGGHSSIVYASSTMYDNQESGFNITNLVKDWIDGYYFPESGFIMLNTNESLNKAFCSSEFSTASKKPRVVLTYTTNGSGGGNDFESAVELALNSPVSVNIVAPNEQRFFSFRPAATGFYTFESSYNDGDPQAWLYNYNGEELVTCDDTSNANFSLTYHLVADCIYYFGAGCCLPSAGAYTVTLRTADDFDYVAYSISTIDNAYFVENNTPLKVEYYKFVPAVSGKYLFYSFDATYDPQMWLYDADLNYLGLNDDGAKNYNFRYTDTLIAGETYYIVAAQYGVGTGSYCMRTLIEASIPTDDYYLMNTTTEMYLDIYGFADQEKVHQWSFHTGAQARWTFEKDSDGYYLIQSKYLSQYYVGVSSNEVNSDNVELYSSVSTKTQWKIYAYSTGELLLEPRFATGTLLYVPDSYEETELQLIYMSSDDGKAEWKFEVKSDTLPEGQQMSKWCWAASARMLTNHYFSVPTNRNQPAAVAAVFGSEKNDGGSLTDTIKAASFYRTGTTLINSLDLVYFCDARFSSNVLRRFINDGHVLFIARGQYPEGERDGGHAYTIVGYTTIYINGSMHYRYVVYDPYPSPAPDPWNNPVITSGRTLLRSYEWISNGQNPQYGDGAPDTKIWDQCIVVKTSYSSSTIAPAQN